MNRVPTILTNLAFHQSRTWSAAVATICGKDESPDELGALRQLGRLLRLRARYDVVVTMGPRPSLAYGLACALLHLDSKQVLTEVFLDAPRPASPLWRAKTALFRLVARRALGLLTNSSAEVDFIARRFGIPEAKLRFVPLYTTLQTPGLAAADAGPVLSIGRTLRDIDTLLQAAAKIDRPLELVVGKRDRLPAKLPARTTVFRDIPLEDVRDRLRGAAVVAIPLLPAERSTGQVVMFEAMALGKPVVATRAAGTEDYLRDGENGLLVAPRDADALAAAVNRLLRDRAFAGRLGQAALQDCRNEFDAERHAERKLAAIGALWRASATS